MTVRIRIALLVIILSVAEPDTDRIRTWEVAGTSHADTYIVGAAAPISTLSGAAPAGSSLLCTLLGSTTPFTPQKPAQLYETSTSYLALYRASRQKAITNGFILEADRAMLLAQAKEVRIPVSTPTAS